LGGVNVESDPHKETLLGVSMFLIIKYTFAQQPTMAETIFIHAIYLFQFACTGSLQCQRPSVLDIQVGPHAFDVLIFMLPPILFLNICYEAYINLETTLSCIHHNKLQTLYFGLFHAPIIQKHQGSKNHEPMFISL